MDFWVSQVFNGFSYGALLFLLAAGLTLIFGMMRIINLTHGSYFLLGGYVGLTVIRRTESFLLAILAAAVVIALTNPQLLLMDEPTEGLAPLLVREVGRVIAELKAQGLSILLVEQNLPMALAVADRVHVVSRGQIVHSCAPDALWHDDDVKTRYLGL